MRSVHFVDLHSVLVSQSTVQKTEKKV